MRGLVKCVGLNKKCVKVRGKCVEIHGKCIVWKMSEALCWVGGECGEVGIVLSVERMLKVRGKCVGRWLESELRGLF